MNIKSLTVFLLSFIFSLSLNSPHLCTLYPNPLTNRYGSFLRCDSPILELLSN